MSEPEQSGTPPGGPKPFQWTRRRLTAAAFLAEDDLVDEAIASRVGVTSRQLRKWKRCPEFAARVEALAEQRARAVVVRAVARRDRRLKALDDRWRALRQVISERGADPEMADVPGGKTGLLVRTTRGVGRGEDYQLVTEYTVDVALLKELREHERQGAIEAGEWSEKREVTGKDGKPIEVTDPKSPDWSRLTVEELECVLELHDAIASRGPAAPPAGDGAAPAG